MKRFWAMLLVSMWMTVPMCAQTSTAQTNPPDDPVDQRASHFTSSQSFSYVQPLPDAPSQRPLTDREKFNLFTQDATSPLTFISAGFTAGTNTVDNRVYGSGWSGMGKNYAAAVAEHETSSFFGNYLFPSLLNQDPRYHPSEMDGFWKRSTYAASRVLITRNDYGQKTVNSSYLLGVLVSTAIGNLYRPPRYRNAGQTLADFGSTVGGDAGMNVLKEFWPEVRQRLRPLTPKKFRKLEDKLVGYNDPTSTPDHK